MYSLFTLAWPHCGGSFLLLALIDLHQGLPPFLMANCLSASATAVLGCQVHAQTMLNVEGIGRVPAKIDLACEQATGDVGQEAFHDAEWEFFWDCVNDEPHKERR